MRAVLPLMLLALGLTGCATAPQPMFTPMSTPLRWPSPPDPARIEYVGQLQTDRDLQAGKTGLQLFGEVLFGEEDPRGMVTPYAVAVGGSRLFVADSGAACMHVFDLETRRYRQWVSDNPAQPLQMPVGIAWDPAGRVLVADSAAGAVVVFDTDGHRVGTLGAGHLKRPCGIAVEPGTRRIAVADAAAHRVLVLNPDGKPLAILGSQGSALGQFNAPTNVAFDHQGRLYVTDGLNCRIVQYSRDLKPIRQIGSRGDLPGYFGQPKGLAVDSEDHLYVIDARFESVQIFDDQGRFLLDFGEEGREPGQFWLPSGIAMDARNRLWVADGHNHRVQVFDYLAEKKP